MTRSFRLGLVIGSVGFILALILMVGAVGAKDESFSLDAIGKPTVVPENLTKEIARTLYYPPTRPQSLDLATVDPELSWRLLW